MTIPLFPCPSTLTIGTPRLITNWQSMAAALLLPLVRVQALLTVPSCLVLASR